MKKIEVPIIGKIIAQIADAQDEEKAKATAVLTVELAANTHVNGRLHLERSRHKYYVLVIDGGTDTNLHGPVDTAEQQSTLAREIYTGDDYRREYDSIFRLNITPEARPQVLSFPHGFFGDE